MFDARKMSLTFGLTLAALLAAPPDGDAQAARAPRKGYVPANGVNYYYEIHGQGQPLLLLHGGLGSIDMFGPVLPLLGKQRQVIAVDLHGHGRTALGDRPINLIDIGNDLATLLRKLDYDTVDVLGYSFGGGAAFRLAVQHPGLVRRLAIVSAPYAQDGFYPEMLPQQAQVGAAMAEAMKPTPMYQSYVAVALMRFYQLLGGGQRDAGWQREHMSKHRLAILPDLTHYETFMAPQMAPTVLPFLNGESVAPSWANQVKGGR